jgi:superfamily II DNA/RNA helicase
MSQRSRRSRYSRPSFQSIDSPSMWSLTSKKLKSGGFESLGLSKPIYKAIKGKGYRVPTPIQRKCLPIVLVWPTSTVLTKQAGRDIVAMARTV